MPLSTAGPCPREELDAHGVFELEAIFELEWRALYDRPRERKKPLPLGPAPADTGALAIVLTSPLKELAALVDGPGPDGVGLGRGALLGG